MDPGAVGPHTIWFPFPGPLLQKISTRLVPSAVSQNATRGHAFSFTWPYRDGACAVDCYVVMYFSFVWLNTRQDYFQWHFYFIIFIRITLPFYTHHVRTQHLPPTPEAVWRKQTDKPCIHVINECQAGFLCLRGASAVYPNGKLKTARGGSYAKPIKLARKSLPTSQQQLFGEKEHHA